MPFGTFPLISHCVDCPDSAQLWATPLEN